MAIAKLILNGVTQMDLTSDTISASTALSGYTGHRANGEAFQGDYAIPSGTLSITSNGTYNVTSYASAAVSVSGGGDDPRFDKLVDRTLSVAIGDASVVGSYAFTSMSTLITASFPFATEVGSYAFYSCSSLVSVSFPQATSIYNYAFFSCAGLQEAYFPTATMISMQAFAQCSSLSILTAPNVAGSIGGSAFYNTKKLSSVSFPNVRGIGNSAFALGGIEEAIFSSASYLGAGAFISCSSLSNASFNLVSDVGASAFKSCSSLISAYFPVAYGIGTQAFYGCVNLQTAYFSKASSIYSSAFYYCTSLSSLTAPNVTTVYADAFNSCWGLTSVSFLYISSIAQNLFASCVNLGTAIFSSASRIIASAFYRCIRLKSLYLLGTSLCALSATNAFTSTPISTYTTILGENGSVFVRASLYDEYISATNWATYSARIVSLTDAQIQNVLTYGTHNP